MTARLFPKNGAIFVSIRMAKREFYNIGSWWDNNDIGGKMSSCSEKEFRSGSISISLKGSNSAPATAFE